MIGNEVFVLLENNVPVFNQNITVINVTLGETFVLELEATDADDDALTFDVPVIPPGATFNSTGNRLFFIWNVESPEEVVLKYN